MTHAALAVLALAFWVVVGHGHTPYVVAAMLAAIHRDHQRTQPLR